jgi:transmembrane sensor
MSRESADAVQAAAARWVARMDGEWTDELEAELQIWMAADPRRQGALLQAEATWQTVNVLRRSAEDDDMSARRFSRRWVLAGGGAAIAASLAGGLFLLNRDASFTTDVGEIRRIPLADGSMAAINTSSRIDIKLEARARNVSIERGEAWFQVAKDPTRPFTVEAGRVRVQAVGTAFSVRRRDGGADVLVTEGVVEAWVAGAEGHRVRLAAGSRAFVADNAAIEEAPTVASSVDRTLAWRDGKIDLAGDPLIEAAAEFNRYNRRQIKIVDPELAREQVDGVFRTDDPEGFATAIKSTLDVPVDLSNPDEIRIGRARE